MIGSTLEAENLVSMLSLYLFFICGIREEKKRVYFGMTLSFSDFGKLFELNVFPV